MRLSPRPNSVLFLLFLSGVAGLIYEVVWTRWLTGLLGSASAATAIVLAVFMAGMGMGSWLSARFADRTARPIRAYAILELCIVLLVLLPLWEVGWMTGLFKSLAQRWGPLSAGLDVVRFLTAIFAIGPPTVLMGASLPLIVKALAHSPEQLGRQTATAYATNTLGGVFGTLLAGFFLIEAMGVRGTCLVAAGMGALAGGLALWLDRRASSARRAIGSDLAKSPHPEDQSRHTQRRRTGIRKGTPSAGRPKDVPIRPLPAPRAPAHWVLVAALVTGFCALGYETIWFRILSVMTLNTTYAFSLMLAILLLGLSLGSWLIRGRLDRSADPVQWFVIIQMLLSLYALSSLLWAPQIAGVAERLVGTDTESLSHAWFARPLILALGLLLVPTILMGASLPVACKLYALLTEGVGRPVGRTYAANTFGSVLGSLVVGLVVIPAWGIWWAVAVCALAGAATAAGIAWVYASRPRRAMYAVAASTVAIASITLGFTHGGRPVVRGSLSPRDEVRMRWDDEYGVVEVIEDTKIGTRWLYTNRLHWEGSTLPRAVAEQRRQGLLPLVLHPSPKRVLEIGLGTGIKLAALRLPVVRKAVAVEISPGVIHASRLFADYNYGITLESQLNDEKVRIVCADGRNYVALVPQEFDLIVNGLLTPYRAGVGRLYTIEHFHSCRSKLAPDGMFVVWVAVRQIAPDDLKILVRTLMRVFPHTTMWLDGYYLALVSTVQPPAWDAEPIQRRYRKEALRKALDEAAVDSVLSLLATFVAGPETLEQYAGSGPLNTEDRPIIEFSTPRQGDRLNTKELAAEIFDVLHLYQEPLCPRYLAAEGETRSRLEQAQESRWTARRGLVEASRGRHIKAAKLFGQALAIDATDDLARCEMETYLVAHGQQCIERGLLDQARHVFRQAVSVNPRSIGALASLATLEDAAGNWAEAEELRHRVMAIDPHNGVLRRRLANLPDHSVGGRF